MNSVGEVVFRTSRDPVGAPIFYRDVPLPFLAAIANIESIRWRLGSVSSPDAPRTVLDNMPVCGNCHSFSADGKTLAMDVDYSADKGSYIITDVNRDMVLQASDVISWSDYESEDGEPTFGLLAQISPDGRSVVSTVKDRSVFIALRELAYSQLFFPVRGILVVYDRSSRVFSALPGASDRELVQSNPVWSPDGTSIVFARAPARRLKSLRNPNLAVLTRSEVEEFLTGSASMAFDLYRVPFNDGLGGDPEPHLGASGNGRSNFFPKFSPDGKWIVFCQAEAFMLLRPDSELFIMPADGGIPRRMRCNFHLKMNSWHSWSPNSRWLVFSSKANGPYTQLWLTHIDEDGVDSPPVLLDRFTAPDRAANIPEFVNIEPGEMGVIEKKFVDEVRLAIKAGDLQANVGNFERAVESYVLALGQRPHDVGILEKLAGVFLSLNDLESALRYLDEAIGLEPYSHKVNYQLGRAMMAKGDTEKAIEHFRLASELEIAGEAARIALAKALDQAGRGSEALAVYQDIVDTGFEDITLLMAYGEALLEARQFERASDMARRVLALDPANRQARRLLGEVLRAPHTDAATGTHLGETQDR